MFKIQSEAKQSKAKKKLSGTHTIYSSCCFVSFSFLDKPPSNIMDPPMNPHISINTLAEIKAYNNFINDEDQPGEEERKNFKEFQWKEII